NEVPLKARMLALKVPLALIVFGGIASALVLHLSLASAHKAPPSGAGPVLGDCIMVPHACGFPDATNTGVPNGTALRTVPGQVSIGSGWHFAPGGGYVVVTA